VQECLWEVARRWRRVSTMEMPLAYARRVLCGISTTWDGDMRCL
jgi:hypothetical protein